MLKLLKMFYITSIYCDFFKVTFTFFSTVPYWYGYFSSEIIVIWYISGTINPLKWKNLHTKLLHMKVFFLVTF